MTARRTARPTSRRRTSRPTIALFQFDFGIAESAPIGRCDEELCFVPFVCGCVGVVARGRMIRRAGGLALVCAHVAAD